MFLHHRSNIDQQKLLFYHLINKKLKNSKTWKHQPSDSVMFLCSRVSRVKGTRQGHRRLEIQLRTPQKQLRKKNHKTSATKLYTQYSVIFLKAGAHTSFFFPELQISKPAFVPSRSVGHKRQVPYLTGSDHHQSRRQYSNTISWNRSSPGNAN